MKLCNKKFAGISMILVITALSLSSSMIGLLDSWQIKLTNKLFEPGKVRSDIVILGLDDKSLQERDNGTNFSDRENFAKAFQNVLDLNPAVLAIDFVFTPNDNISNSDLRSAITKIIASDEEGFLNRKVFEKEFLPYIVTPNPKDKALADILSDRRVILGMSVSDVKAITNGEIQNDDFIRSIDTIHNAAPNIANLSIEIDENDELARKYFTKLKMQDGEYIENLAVAAGRLFGSPYTDQIPTIDANRRMYINYFGLPGAYETLSLADALNGKLTKNMVEGKIILFGPTSRFFNDIEHTPISPKEQMVGVEIHANALQTILDGKFLIDAAAAAKAAATLLMTAIAVGVFMYASIRVALAVFLTLWISYYFGNKLAFGRGVILDQIYPYLALALSLVSVFMYRFFTESKEKDFVRTAFSSYVSPDVLKQITDDPGKLKLGGEEKIVTVLFSDIKDSTTIGEGLSAHSLVGLLNEYFSEMSDVVIRNGGTVDKFEGDAIMAVFGAPLNDPNHAALACRAALDMQAQLIRLRAKWKLEGKPELYCRIGINSGPVIAGNIGSKDRFDYTVMGDTVNLGSRLEGANKQYGTQIMVGKNTFDAVQAGKFKDMFTFRYLDKIIVKGKTQATEVYELNEVT